MRNTTNYKANKRQYMSLLWLLMLSLGMVKLVAECEPGSEWAPVTNVAHARGQCAVANLTITQPIAPAAHQISRLKSLQPGRQRLIYFLLILHREYN